MPTRRTPLDHQVPTMCRNIRTLFNFEPPATELEIRDARPRPSVTASPEHP